jgi:hypothetical protein
VPWLVAHHRPEEPRLSGYRCEMCQDARTVECTPSAGQMHDGEMPCPECTKCTTCPGDGVLVRSSEGAPEEQCPDCLRGVPNGR